VRWSWVRPCCALRCSAPPEWQLSQRRAACRATRTRLPQLSEQYSRRRLSATKKSTQTGLAQARSRSRLGRARSSIAERATAASGSAASAERRGARAADQSSCGATGSRRLARLIASSAPAGGRRPRTAAVNVCRSASRSAWKSARLISVEIVSRSSRSRSKASQAARSRSLASRSCGRPRSTIVVLTRSTAAGPPRQGNDLSATGAC